MNTHFIYKEICTKVEITLAHIKDVDIYSHTLCQYLLQDKIVWLSFIKKRSVDMQQIQLNYFRCISITVRNCSKQKITNS